MNRMQSLRNEPRLEFRWDGWWLVENGGAMISGPMGELQAQQELRWARAEFHGHITYAGREELRRRAREERDALYRQPSAQALAPYWGLLLVALGLWGYVLFFTP